MLSRTSIEWASRPARRDRAIVLTVDNRAYPFGELVARRILELEPSLEVVVCLEDPTLVPARYRDDRVRHCKLAQEPVLDPLPLSSVMSRSTYHRLLLPAQLGSSYKRILYLDSDILVTRKGLGDLLSADMNGFAIGAAPDLSALIEPPSDLRAAYRNSGVLLIDCESDASHAAIANAIAYAVENPETLVPHHDQSALNAVMEGQMALLGPRWNLIHNPLLASARSKVDPVVLHFAGRRKPWVRSQFPDRMEYRAFYLGQLSRMFSRTELRTFGLWGGNEKGEQNPVRFVRELRKRSRLKRRRVEIAREYAELEQIPPANVQAYIDMADIR